MKQYYSSPSLGNKNLTAGPGHLRLIVSDRSVGAVDSDALFANFCDLKNIWHRTKLEADRERAMRAYNAWIVGSFPKDQQIPLLLHSTSAWGFN